MRNFWSLEFLNSGEVFYRNNGQKLTVKGKQAESVGVETKAKIMKRNCSVDAGSTDHSSVQYVSLT